VVVAFGGDPWLERCVHSLLASEGVHPEVVVVDNGGNGAALDRLAELEAVTVVGSGDNIGFAGGCNLGAAASNAPFIALVNPDAIVEPDALAELLAVAARAEVGIATASVRLADRPDLLNSAGNALHFLGVSWAGYYQEPAEHHHEERPVIAASGAALACRREVWDALDGFPEEYFAYYEDADMSLRSWQRGWQVIFVPRAVVVHRYGFSRNPVKWRLLERNRVAMVLTCFGARHLVLAAPAFIALEGVVLLYAATDGWLRLKLASYAWLLRNRRWLRDRRARVQRARVVPDRDIAHLLDAHLRPANLPPPRALLPLDRMLAVYWHVIRRLL
jgi:GT2 family glycosyltransferase